MNNNALTLRLPESTTILLEKRVREVKTSKSDYVRNLIEKDLQIEPETAQREKNKGLLAFRGILKDNGADYKETMKKIRAERYGG